MRSITYLYILIITLSLSAVSANAATASWYGPKFHGKLTASGERYDMNTLTAAHNSLPFGTKVQVTNTSNKKSVIVKINDRGGFGKYGRVIDISKKANQLIDCGLCQVTLKILK